MTTDKPSHKWTEAENKNPIWYLDTEDGIFVLTKFGDQYGQYYSLGQVELEFCSHDKLTSKRIKIIIEMNLDYDKLDNYIDPIIKAYNIIKSL